MSIGKAQIAYLSTPQRGVYVINFQREGSEHLEQIEVSRAHLSNLIIDGTTLALRDIDSRSETGK